MDLALSTLGLLCSAPLYPLIALAIKLDDGGAIFFSQVRWGKDGRKLVIRKFRTMVVHANGLEEVRQAIENDERITSVGRSDTRTTGQTASEYRGGHSGIFYAVVHLLEET